jgi:monoamine oxidase
MAGKSYIVLGAGQQGLAAAFELALNGNAARITLGGRLTSGGAGGRPTDQKTSDRPRGALAHASASSRWMADGNRTYSNGFADTTAF